jgi:hypothetical protein
MTPPAALAAGLGAHAQGLWCLEAAAELLISGAYSIGDCSDDGYLDYPTASLRHRAAL